MEFPTAAHMASSVVYCVGDVAVAQTGTQTQDVRVVSTTHTHSELLWFDDKPKHVVPNRAMRRAAKRKGAK